MIIKYKQDNGLSILLEPVEGVVSVSAGLWLKIGSRNERAEQYGYAHFVEHMLFKGTKDYNAADIARLVDRVGGQHNAATNREYTCYYINVISEQLELAIKILSDMYYNSLFDSVELDKEKNVIIEEIRMYEDTPDEFVHDLFMESMLIGHPLSHSILGTQETISGTTRESLTSFYDDHYGNGNAVFAVAGNFDSDVARGLVAKYFSSSRTVNLAAKPIVNTSPERIYFRHVPRDLEQVHFCIGVDGIRKNDHERWGLYLLSTILGGSMSSRLFQNIREKEGICYSIYSFHSSFTDHGIFGIYCAASPENYPRAIELTMKECREIMEGRVTEEELQDAKTFMKGNLVLNLESVEVRMGQLAKNEITFGRYFSIEDILNEINNISLDDFHKIGKKLFHNKRMSLVSVGDVPESVIREQDLQL